jgi:hypothetical protein
MIVTFPFPFDALVKLFVGFVVTPAEVDEFVSNDGSDILIDARRLGFPLAVVVTGIDIGMGGGGGRFNCPSELSSRALLRLAGAGGAISVIPLLKSWWRTFVSQESLLLSLASAALSLSDISSSSSLSSSSLSYS